MTDSPIWLWINVICDIQDSLTYQKVFHIVVSTTEVACPFPLQVLIISKIDIFAISPKGEIEEEENKEEEERMMTEGDEKIEESLEGRLHY